ncbi:hypothetical protein C8P68_105216 [Mucilaginibacter yixingensis]|uniref:Uncharacterized protein n=1 Tax=Mucilaginibacter yixingensis TaxID=1295612 RepID=A0A2T5J8B7_9SPHI|nr:hypothetical protein C8P68_105216 [Mucilaginibacter yixingensis]
MQFNNLKRACLLFFILITITIAVKAFAQQQNKVRSQNPTKISNASTRE